MHFQRDDIINGKYRIESFLGKGAFAEVYRASNIETSEVCAVKISRKDFEGMGGKIFAELKVRRFEPEAELGKQISHPRVIAVKDSYINENDVVIVMEFAPGGNLADFLRDKRERKEQVTYERALEIAIDIADGLSAIHELHIVHRDLNPNNILLDTDQRAMVADLGLAQIRGGRSMRSQMGSQAESQPGTPEYMSPEQSVSYGYLKPSSDIYALGLILFEILTGEHIHHYPPSTTLKSIQPDAPVELSNLIARMLSNDPDKRPWKGSAAVEELSKVQTLLQNRAAEITRLYNEGKKAARQQDKRVFKGIIEKLTRLEPGGKSKAAELQMYSERIRPTRQTPSQIPWYKKPYVPIVVGLLSGLISLGVLGVMVTNAFPGLLSQASPTTVLPVKIVLPTATQNLAITVTPALVRSSSPIVTQTTQPLPSFTFTNTYTPEPSPTFTETPQPQPTDTTWVQPTTAVPPRIINTTAPIQPEVIPTNAPPPEDVPTAEPPQVVTTVAPNVRPPTPTPP